MFEEEHLLIAWSLHDLAVLYMFQREYHKSELHFLEALGIYENLLGKEHQYFTTSNEAKLGSNHPMSQGIRNLIDSLPQPSA
jgi:hypothetical protein